MSKKILSISAVLAVTIEILQFFTIAAGQEARITVSLADGGRVLAAVRGRMASAEPNAIREIWFLDSIAGVEGLSRRRSSVKVFGPGDDVIDDRSLAGSTPIKRAAIGGYAYTVDLTPLGVTSAAHVSWANGTGGVLNTNFGLGTLGTTGSQPILNRKTVASGLSGFTAAIIKSDQIPIVMTALANETDSRVVSTPQLLVDDNEEASVVSIDKQPTSTAQTTDGGNQIVSAGQSAEAGTKLTVTPQISDGGYLRLQYEIELSSFTGEAQTVGNTVLPPPSQVNTLKSESVTVPSDSTVVVGGLVVDQDTKSVAKIPLLGDIPLFGKLFGDERKGDRKTVLYVFLTPRILRDPGFEDLRLLTSGPQAASKIPNEFPSLSPQMIDVNASSFDIPAAAVPPESTPAPVQPAEKPARQQAVPNNGKPVARQVTKVPQTPPPGQPAKPAQEPLNPDD